MKQHTEKARPMLRTAVIAQQLNAPHSVTDPSCHPQRPQPILHCEYFKDMRSDTQAEIATALILRIL